jgi:hypothetical protein
MAQTALMRPDDSGRLEALREAMAETLLMDEPRKHFAALLSQLDIRYEFGEGHPLLGRRMPDLDLSTPDGPLRVYSLLHQAKPVLINLGEPGSLDITLWADRVQQVDASHDGPWELPVVGEVDPRQQSWSAPTATSPGSAPAPKPASPTP